MDPCSVKSEILRLLLKKATLEKQVEALSKMSDVIDKQLLGLEVEGLQLASEMRMKEDPTIDDSETDPEGDDSEMLDLSEEELNKTELNLDSRLEDILSGKFYDEEDEEEETEDF